MHFISKCIHLELNYWCISFLSSEFQDSGPHHAATVDTDRLRPGARYLYLQSPAAGLCNWMQIFIWAPVSCHVAFIHLPVVLNFHSEQAVFWNRTAMRVPCSVGNLSSASWFCLPLLIPVSKSKYFNCDKSLWKDKPPTGMCYACGLVSGCSLPRLIAVQHSPPTRRLLQPVRSREVCAVWFHAAQSSGLNFTNS